MPPLMPLLPPSAPPEAEDWGGEVRGGGEGRLIALRSSRHGLHAAECQPLEIDVLARRIGERGCW
eukprot:6180488-Pleurochrysis_carterae.AAC.1